MNLVIFHGKSICLRPHKEAGEPQNEGSVIDIPETQVTEFEEKKKEKCVCICACVYVPKCLHGAVHGCVGCEHVHVCI